MEVENLLNMGRVLYLKQKKGRNQSLCKEPFRSFYSGGNLATFNPMKDLLLVLTYKTQ